MRPSGLTRPLLLAALMISMALAGCAGDEKAAPQDIDYSGLDLQADDETGVIRGLVVDAAVRPVEGVQITLDGDEIDEPMIRETDVNGLFGFSALPPGAYEIVTQKAGFSTVRTTTVVVAGVVDPDIVKILVEVDAASLPYVEVYQWDGFLECNFSLFLVRFAACSGVGNDQFAQDYSFNGAPEFLQSEMQWDSTQALGSEMQLSITDFRGDAQTRINASAGVSPVIVGVDRALIDEFEIGTNNTPMWRVFNDAVDETDVAPDEEAQQLYADNLAQAINSTGMRDDINDAYASAPIPYGGEELLTDECVMWPVLFNSCGSAGGFGATIQQEFTVFTHAFYNFAPADGWTFGADGTPAPPA